MEYVVYRRFKAEGIDGAFNLRYGTTVSERDGFLFAADGRKICAATSENGWEHFRPNTPEGAYRQKMLDGLYRYYGKHEGAADFDPEFQPTRPLRGATHVRRIRSSEMQISTHAPLAGRDSKSVQITMHIFAITDKFQMLLHRMPPVRAFCSFLMQENHADFGCEPPK